MNLSMLKDYASKYGVWVIVLALGSMAGNFALREVSLKQEIENLTQTREMLEIERHEAESKASEISKSLRTAEKKIAALDGKGEAIRDKDGNPVFNISRDAEILESERASYQRALDDMSSQVKELSEWKKEKLEKESKPGGARWGIGYGVGTSLEGDLSHLFPVTYSMPLFGLKTSLFGLVSVPSPIVTMNGMRVGGGLVWNP